jgi:hypothetical protein
VAEQSLTISRAGKDETFTVDKSTKVVGKGAGTKSSASGGRVAITDVVSNGDRVTVTYDSMGGSMVAKEVRVNSKGSMAPKK